MLTSTGLLHSPNYAFISHPLEPNDCVGERIEKKQKFYKDMVMTMQGVGEEFEPELLFGIQTKTFIFL